MIFLDTPGIIALAVEDDRYHDAALGMLEAAEQAGEKILTHNYVIVESCAVLQRKIGLQASLALLRSASSFVVHWVEPELHAAAIEHLARNNSSKLSFVDAISFLVMQQRKTTRYLGFDPHFAEAGFRQFESHSG